MFVLFLLWFAAIMSEQEEYFMIRQKKRRERQNCEEKGSLELVFALGVCVYPLKRTLPQQN